MPIKTKREPRERVYILDALRGVAILAMIVHHTYVLLNFILGVQIAFFHSELFSVLQMFFVGIFLLVSGICTNYSHNIAKRGGIIFAAAVLVTLVTAVLLPSFGVDGLQIYFGILHMFGLSMLLYALIKPLLDRCATLPVLIISAVLFVAQYIWMIFVPFFESPYDITMIFGFPSETFYSADYYPLFPYFFLFVSGAMLGRLIKARKFPSWFYTFRARPFEFVGRHSLIIYLVHQPIIFALIELYTLCLR